MKRTLLLIFILLISYQASFSQRTCASILNLDNIEKHDPTRYQRILQVEKHLERYNEMLSKEVSRSTPAIIRIPDKDKLVGISRSLTDFCYCCYLSDLAVRKDYQTAGIGTKLIELTKNNIGGQTALILLSAPTAMDYYPKVGFQKIDNGFIIKRTK